MAGPKRCRDHDALASMSAMTTSAGRLFYIFDEGHTSLVHRPPDWRLVARDAFDGMSAAYGRLYIPLKDGSLLCMGPGD